MKTSIIHVFLFAIYPIIFLFSKNIGEVYGYEILWPIAFMLVFSLILLLLAFLATKDILKAGLYTSVFIILFFLYGHVYNLVYGREVFLVGTLLVVYLGLLLKVKRSPKKSVLMMFALVFTAVFYFLKTSKELYLQGWGVDTNLYRFVFSNMFSLWLEQFAINTNFYLLQVWILLIGFSVYFISKINKISQMVIVFNIVALILMFMSVLDIALYKFNRTNGNFVADSVIEAKDEKKLPEMDVNAKRDIYYIILDGYANYSTLKEIYSYQDDDFNKYLKDKGFYLADKSQANYPFTFLSLASSLNMEYLNYISDRPGSELYDETTTYGMIKNSKVMNFLRANGYIFVNFNSGWRATTNNEYADPNLCGSRFNDFNTTLVQMTMLRAFEDRLIGTSLREKTLCTFTKLPKLSKIGEPKFVFAHILAPHPPFLFGKNGEEINNGVELSDISKQTDVNYWQQKDNYVNQSIFVANNIKNVIDEIISNSETKPIVILQSDHGPASLLPHPGSSNLSDRYIWQNPTDDMLKERMRIFNAYYLPGNGDKSLYQSISPVNSFRMIFNYYFGANYEIIPDKSYFSDPRTPYDFIDVSYKVRF